MGISNNELTQPKLVGFFLFAPIDENMLTVYIPSLTVINEKNAINHYV